MGQGINLTGQGYSRVVPFWAKVVVVVVVVVVLEYSSTLTDQGSSTLMAKVGVE